MPRIVQKPAIGGFLFDWGEVLIHVALPQIADYCARHLGVDIEDFLEAFHFYAELFQEGRIEEDDMWKDICAQLEVQQPSVPSLWESAWRHHYRERDDMFQFVAHLKGKGYKTALVSNCEWPVVNGLKAVANGQYKLFDEKLFSCQEGIAKPDPEIYRRALNRLNLQPQEAVFIDDRQENIDAAKALGIHGVLFQSPQQVKHDLAMLGLPSG